MIDRYGDEGSTLVVALHGSPANRKAWLGLARVLPSGTTLLVPDLPGHGSQADVPFSIDAALAQLAATIAREGRPAIVIGDSLGGYLALAAASRLTDVVAVVAGGCTFEMRGVASTLARASDLPLRAALGIFGARAVDAFVARALPHVMDAAIARATVGAGLRLAARGESIGALSRLRVADLVRTARVPIVFVNGSRDWPTRAGERHFLAIARSAELVLAPGSPHGASLFAPETFVRAIARARELARERAAREGGGSSQTWSAAQSGS